MTAIDPNPAWESGFQCGYFLGVLSCGMLATLLWGARDFIQGRMNRLPVNEDWPNFSGNGPLPTTSVSTPAQTGQDQAAKPFARVSAPGVTGESQS